MWDPSHSQVVALKEKIVKYCLRWREQPVIFEFLWIFQSIALQIGLYARIQLHVQKQATTAFKTVTWASFWGHAPSWFLPWSTCQHLQFSLIFLPRELVWLEVPSRLSLERVLKPRASEFQRSPVLNTPNCSEVTQLCAGGEKSLPPIYNRNGPSQIRKRQIESIIFIHSHINLVK